jgi:predicted transcriptional regulator
LSVKPKYADLIVSGEKRVEFRRVWAAEEVGLIAIYTSSPVQRIVALVDVEDVVRASPQRLWRHCTSLGGGLTAHELADYFDGKAHGYAVLLGEVRKFKKPVDPRILFKTFSAPQSFRYLTATEIKRLEERAITGEEKK